MVQRNDQDRSQALDPAPQLMHDPDPRPVILIENNGTADPYTLGMDRDIIIDVAIDLFNNIVSLLDTPPDWLLGFFFSLLLSLINVCLNSMVVLDHGIKGFSKVFVGVPVHGVDAKLLIVKLDITGDGFGTVEATGVGDLVLDLVPPLLGHMLGDKGVFELDNGDFFRHGEALDICKVKLQLKFSIIVSSRFFSSVWQALSSSI